VKLRTWNFDGFVKSLIFPFIWIPACAGMTMKMLIPSRHNSRHTRAGGYPGGKVTFYDFINFELSAYCLPLTKQNDFNEHPDNQ
jgi:hypothetical protein